MIPEREARAAARALVGSLAFNTLVAAGRKKFTTSGLTLSRRVNTCTKKQENVYFKLTN